MRPNELPCVDHMTNQLAIRPFITDGTTVMSIVLPPDLPSGNSTSPSSRPFITVYAFTILFIVFSLFYISIIFSESMYFGVFSFVNMYITSFRVPIWFRSAIGDNIFIYLTAIRLFSSSFFSILSICSIIQLYVLTFFTYL